MATQEVSRVLAASRMANVRYAIRDLAVVADEVAREGHQILYLNIGDPCKFDFHTPPHMIEAVLKAMVDGHNGYCRIAGHHAGGGSDPPSGRAQWLSRHPKHLHRLRQRRGDRQLPDRAAQSRRQRADA